MATVNLGRIKPQWQGSWSSSTQYVTDDMVAYNNDSWIATTTSTNSAPSDGNSDWDLLARGVSAGSVTATEIADGAITAAKISDATITAAKLAPGAAVPDQSGNAGKVLKTDGSSLSWGDGGKVLQTVYHATPVATVSVPARNNSYANMRQVSTYSKSITTTVDNSYILINGHINIRSNGHTHDYFDMQCTRSDTSTTWWLSQNDGAGTHPSYSSNTDGIIANHTGNVNDSTNSGLVYLVKPGAVAGTTFTFTYWIGSWGSSTMYWNEYGNANAHGVSEIIYQEILL